MIELTTGVAFLLSSMYGAGQANTANIIDSTSKSNNPEESAIVSTTTSTILEHSDVEAYVRKEFADTPILIEIARCESNFNQFSSTSTLAVVRGRVNKKDVGVMQINEYYHADDAIRQGINLYTTEGNVKFGKYLYEKYGSSAWSASKPCWGSAEIARK